MSLRSIAICVVCVLTATAGSRGDDSESKQLIQEGVNKARSKFDLTEERLTNELLADFDRAMESARASAMRRLCSADFGLPRVRTGS